MLEAFLLGSLLGFQEQSLAQIRLLSRLDEAVRLRRHGERRLGSGHLRRGVRAPRSDGVARGIPAGLEGGEFGLLTRGCTGCPPHFSGSCVLVLASSSAVCVVLLSNVQSDPSACLWSARNVHPASVCPRVLCGDACEVRAVCERAG
jgi:hypothetical protein